MIRTPSFIALALAGMLAACSAPEPEADGSSVQHAQRIFTGGTIHTGLGRTVDVVAVRNGRVIYAGDAQGLDALTGSETEIVDLAGATMFPGFTDSHAHLIGIGQRERTLNLEETASITDLQARVSAYAEANPDGVISGRGWIETHWPEARFPSAADLDTVVSDRPVILIRADGHALVANTAAMDAAGVTAQTPDPEGGEILRDPDGAATGMIIDAAMAPFRALLADPSPAERVEIYASAAAVMARHGWTGVHDMSVPYGDVDILEQLAEAGRLPLRVHVSANPAAYDEVAARSPRIHDGGRVTARAVKLYADGALGSRGAALINPYADSPGSSGLLLMQEEQAGAMMDNALRDGVQLAIHAIGDLGNRLVLDWVEAAYARVPVEERAVAEPRWRIEHTQVVSPSDLPRIAELGLIASMQPSHAIGDLHFAPARLGLQRLSGAYAWRDIMESGAVIAGGSDAPVERGEPRIEFYAATVRRDLDGYADPETWHLEQALSREEALRLFTVNAAYAAFREGELGTIAPGTLADFSVFDTDLMTADDLDLRHARPVMTVVDGE
ncbi:MAG: amidohydrolase, partial [Caulobacterales bacterium]|uniref:amidohydrolase n=1 Tax=Glycocaulis sp. TaxID=1969725 RepID=UPI003F9F14F7